MRVVLVGFFAADYLIALANALAKANDVTLILARQNLEIRFPNETNLTETLFSRGLLDPRIDLRFIHYPSGRYLAKLAMARTLVRDIRALQPDVIHYQSGGDPYGVLSLFFLRAFPLVVTIHDATRHPGDGISDLYLNTTNAIVTRLADRIIVHGEQQARALTETQKVPRRKIHVHPIGGYDMYVDHAVQPAGADDHLVLFFGRLRAYKGVDVLLEAAPQVAAQIPDARFVIAGSGECPELAQAAQGHPGLFEIHNRFIEADEVQALFERAAVVVQPYVDASQSGVIPLAYRFGRPVVATRVGSIPEVVEDGRTGVLVPPRDASALAEATIRLLRDDDLRIQMGKAAWLKSESELSWDAIARKTVEVYENVLEKSVSPNTKTRRPKDSKKKNFVSP